MVNLDRDDVALGVAIAALVLQAIQTFQGRKKRKPNRKRKKGRK